MYPFFNFMLMSPLFIPTDNRPPSIYDIMNAMVNFNTEDKTKTKDLAKATHSKIFDFDYPLSSNVDKEKFECMILNHFIMRRIGFQTFTAFKIQLNVKLNEIMPLYNKMFDALQNWDIFNDGEVTNRYGNENRKNNTNNTLENTSNTETTTTSDRRESNTPQNQLDNVRNGTYVTNYNYDTDSSNSSDNSNSKGTSNSTDENIYEETIEKSPSDKISILKEMQENIKSIYTMIFKDLEILFYYIP